MTTRPLLARISVLFSSLMLASLVSNSVTAHCDSMSGPVVMDAQAALASKDIERALKWVNQDNEAAIRDAFAMAAAVQEGIQQRFADAYKKRQVAEDSVEQGREYVKAYVEFTHFVVGVDHLVSTGSSHKHLETVAGTTQ